jgi:LPS export ABC transporter permease LptG
MKILTRYILKEMFGPTLLGFTFYTFIILMRQLFDFAAMIIRRSLPFSTVVKLLVLSLPHITVLTVPMSLLFGILIAIGRLSADSEIIAMRALTISTRTIYRPVFLFSFAVFLLNLYLMNVVLPRGNTELQSLKAELFTSSIDKELKPRVFFDEYENLMIYVDDLDPHTNQWKGVFVADSRSGNENTQAPTTIQQSIDQAREENQTVSLAAQRAGQRIIIADRGNLSIVGKNKQLWMNLFEAETHVWDPRKPERYDLTSNGSQRMRLPDRFSATDPSGAYVKSLREMNIAELQQQVRIAAISHDKETLRAAKVEIHKKFAIPFACLVFGVVGLPLGITNRRGGKSSGFSLSVVIILVYYILISNGEHLAVNGRIGPAFGMWFPNVVLLALGIYLMIRANRDAGTRRSESGIVQRLAALLSRARDHRRDAEDRVGAATPEEPAILRRLDITFPNILDRYILREFIKVLSLVLISTAALFTIVDYTDLAGDIRAHHIAVHTVFAYYRFSVFGILNFTLPISVLVATLVTFGILSKNNEVTALKSGGVSLYRVAMPIVGIAVVMSVLSYFMLDYVLPYSNRRSDELRNKIKGKGPVALQHQQKLWFLGKGRYIINFLQYDKEKKELTQVQVFEFHPGHFRLTRRVYADRARWDGEGWVFERGWMRSFSDDGRATFSPINQPLRLFYTEKPDDFATEAKSPEQMTFAQLRRYIETIRKSGYSAEALSVKLYEKTSWPFISLVMALIALPFAFKVGKKGALYGVATALVLGIIYWMIFAVFTKFGEVGNLPAMLAAWSANILFSLAAVYLFLNVET